MFIAVLVDRIMEEFYSNYTLSWNRMNACQIVNNEKQTKKNGRMIYIFHWCCNGCEHVKLAAPRKGKAYGNLTSPKRCRFDLWFGKIPWGRKWQPTLVFLLRKFHRQRSLAGYSPWDRRVGHTWMTKHIRNLTSQVWECMLCMRLPNTNKKSWFLYI